MLELDFAPEGFLENVGDKLGFVAGQTKADLERFRDFITSRGSATGAWRGEVRGGDVRSDQPTAPATGSNWVDRSGVTDVDDDGFDDPYESGAL
jgi:hypothetical protein